MNTARILILIVYIVCIILFTVGYAAMPILKQEPAPGIKHVIYIDRQETSMNTPGAPVNTTIKFDSLGGTAKTLGLAILLTCIAITILLAVSVVISYLGLKRISYITLLPAVIAMGLVFSVLIIMITDNVISNKIKDMVSISPVKIEKNLDYDTGFLLMSIAACLSIVMFPVYRYMG